MEINYHIRWDIYLIKDKQVAFMDFMLEIRFLSGIIHHSSILLTRDEYKNIKYIFQKAYSKY